MCQEKDEVSESSGYVKKRMKFLGLLDVLCKRGIFWVIWKHLKTLDVFTYLDHLDNERVGGAGVWPGQVTPEGLDVVEAGGGVDS